jgi:hypothetical protein
MRLTSAFFANNADVVDGMLNVTGAFWSSTAVTPGAGGFKCYVVVACELDPNDVGREYTLHVDAQGPTGQRWAPVQSSSFTVNGPMLFMCSQMGLPVEFSGGRHVYTFRLDGQHERVDVPIDVRLTPA